MQFLLQIRYHRRVLFRYRAIVYSPNATPWPWIFFLKPGTSICIICFLLFFPANIDYDSFDRQYKQGRYAEQQAVEEEEEPGI